MYNHRKIVIQQNIQISIEDPAPEKKYRHYELFMHKYANEGDPKLMTVSEACDIFPYKGNALRRYTDEYFSIPCFRVGPRSQRRYEEYFINKLAQELSKK